MASIPSHSLIHTNLYFFNYRNVRLRTRFYKLEVTDVSTSKTEWEVSSSMVSWQSSTYYLIKKQEKGDNRMGWAAKDLQTVEQAKIQLVHVRQSMYSLKNMIARIEHKEKREAIQECIKMAQSEIDSVGVHLER